VIRIRRGNVKGRVEDSTKTGDDDDSPKIVPLLPVVADVRDQVADHATWFEAHRERPVETRGGRRGGCVRSPVSWPSR
jgi:hypothetical protein